MALNRNNLKQTPIPVVSRTMQIVNPDGTVTRSGQLLLQQLQASDALQGTHGGRPDPGAAPDGALYVESDRLVLYSNINGAWHYIAGTMWGTINPDQRPTDLGVNDAGFDFRTVDQPAREFIWSQAYWVEVTPVRYGTHAARLAVNVTRVIEQMLWMETDRSNVIYQEQGNAWVYLAGAMSGTLSPDQRPTDLGAADAGFQFNSTDTNPSFTARSFSWSGSAWTETTSQNPILWAVCTAGFTLTTSNQPVPGCSLTLQRPGTYWVSSIFDFAPSNDAGAVLLGSVAGFPGFAVCQVPDAGAYRFTVAQNWMITATAGQSIQLQAYKTAGSGASVCTTQSTITAMWVHP